LPFLGVMVCIYLMPVFVSETLRAGPEIYGFAEVCYSLGAVLAGLTIPGLSTRIGLMRTLLLTVGCYTVAVMVNPLFAAIPVLLASLVLQGWGNAGSRVARSIVALETVPNELMGRVNLFYSAAERLLRSIFLVVVTGQVANSGPRSGYWTISAIGLSGWIMILFSRRFRRDPVIAITRRERAA
jgi:MFS family permease